MDLWLGDVEVHDLGRLLERLELALLGWRELRGSWAGDGRAVGWGRGGGGGRCAEEGRGAVKLAEREHRSRSERREDGSGEHG